MKLIVTGHTGFIGRHLLNHLRNAEVVGICRSAPKDLSTKTISLDIRRINPNQLEPHKKDLEGADAIVHLAAYRPIVRTEKQDSLYENLSTNVAGTFNVLLLAKKFGIGRITLASSKSVYGDCNGVVAESKTMRPITNYGKSKFLAESLCNTFARTYGIKCTVLRFASVYGPGMAPSLVFAEFLNKALKDETITVHRHRSGFEAPELIYVEDVAIAIEQALRWKQNSFFEVFNIGAGVPLDTHQLASRIAQAVRSKSQINAVPTNERRPSVRMSVKKARRILKWAPKFNVVRAIRHFLPRWQSD